MQIRTMPKIVVTGSNGQLGRKVAELLSGSSQLIALSRTELDITDNTQINDVLGELQPDIIINAAAYTAVDKAEQESDKANSLNHLAPSYLAKFAEKSGAVLIHVSTDYVFDGSQSLPYTENDTTGPINVYGHSKLLGEQAVSSLCKKHIIIRTAWVFSEHGSNFVKTMLRLAQNKSELSIVADQHGGPTYAGDLAIAIRKVVEKISSESEISWGVYHYCGVPYVSWFDFAHSIFSHAVDANLIERAPALNAISSESYPTPAKRPKYSKLDCRKIEDEFGVVLSDWQAALSSISSYK